jgi:hypothetical protein
MVLGKERPLAPIVVRVFVECGGRVVIRCRSKIGGESEAMTLRRALFCGGG